MALCGATTRRCSLLFPVPHLPPARTSIRRRPSAHVAIVSLVAIAALVASPAHLLAQRPVTGIVVDSATGLPVVAARVQVAELHRLTHTHVDGRFAFPDLPIGRVTLEVSRLGYRVERRVIDPARDTTMRIVLAPAAIQLETRVVTGALTERPGEEVLSPTTSLSGAALDRSLGTTVAASLANVPGVAVSSLSPSTARPVIRGLGGDRIVILEDGQRPGDLSAMSGDHATTIEPLTAERIEVVRGPMSLLYGASALGGVVNVIREEVPTSRVDGMHASLSAQGSSVNRGGSVGGAVSMGRGALALRIDGSARGSGNTRTPLGPLVNTGVAEYTLAAGLSRVGERGHVGGSYRFYANDYGIPGGFIGGHATGVDIVMRRHAGRLDADLHVARKALENLRVTATLSDYGHSELEPSGALGTRFDQLQFTTEVVARHRPIGAVGNGAVGLRVQGRDIQTGGTLSTPSTRTYGAALFAVEEMTRGALTLQLGGRYEFARYEPRKRTFIDVGGARIPTRDRQFGALAGSVGALWRVADGVRLGTSVSRAFRSPEFDELYSNGPHLAANSYDVGDPSLRAETGLGVDAFVRVNRRRTSAEFAVFRSLLDNYVFPSSRGRIELGAQGGRPRFQFTNENAVFAGAEGRVEWSATPALVFDVTASYVRAHFTSARDSIPVITPDTSYFIGSSDKPPFVPPLSGSAGVRYDRTRWFVSGQLRGSTRQERLGDFEDPTAGYVVPSFGAGLRFVHNSQLHAITLRFDNAFNREYRDHLSRIKAVRPEAGRNLSVLYRLTI